MPIWGVDSYSPAHLPASGTGGLPLYEYVSDYVSRHQEQFPDDIHAPQFWGRYLSHSRPRSALTSDEKNFLHRHGCRIFLVYNDTCWDQHHDRDCKMEVGERTIRLALTGYENGARSAENACQLAHKFLHAPDGTRLYADLEGWFVSEDWLDGWCTEVPDKSRRLGRRYTPGIYGRVLVGAELAFARRTYRRDSWSISIEETMNEQERRHRLLERGFLDPRVGHRSSTSRQPSMDAVRGQPPAAHSSVHIWTNTPRWESRCTGAPDSFQGHSTQGGLTRTVGWQYGMDCPNLNRLVDMDLATQLGFDEMWQ